MKHLQYPIGEFAMPGPLNVEARRAAVAAIAAHPAEVATRVQRLGDARLDQPYRPGGWTGRQVVHHVVDSHINSFMRLKLALSEDVPTIRTYDEQAWSELADYGAPASLSLPLLQALHARWVYLWERLSDADWEREFRHPDMGLMRVDELAAFYSWHGRHHVAHLDLLV